MFNLIMILLILGVSLLLFLVVYISEDNRTKIYEKMEEEYFKKLEGKPAIYKIIHYFIFNIL